MAAYVELQCCTNYSFLRGASRVEELMLQAKALGMEALAVTDHNSLAGIARAHARAKEVGIRLIVGCRFELRDGPPVLAYPTDRAGYARLSRLLTLAKCRGGKGTFDLGWDDLAAAGEGLLLIQVPDMPDDGLEAELRRMRAAFPGRCHLALTLRRRPGDAMRLHGLVDLAQRARVPTVVTNDVLYGQSSPRAAWWPATTSRAFGTAARWWCPASCWCGRSLARPRASCSSPSRTRPASPT